MLFARYAAKLAICCPFALLCYLPLSGFLRLGIDDGNAYVHGKHPSSASDDRLSIP